MTRPNEPVNKLSDRHRNKIIERDYPALRDDLTKLTPDRSVPVILLKVNVCQIVEAKLVRDGFNVINHDVWPPFPSNGQQNKFHDEFGAILRAAGWNQVGAGGPTNRVLNGC